MLGAADVVLSPRQHEVLVLISHGVRAREIAAELGVTQATVRNHIRDVLRRLDCHSQLEAVARARQCRLL
jgi:DNA-binding CsgD family transcriptional regulator